MTGPKPLGWLALVWLLLTTARRRARARMRAAAARRRAGVPGLVYAFALLGSLIFQIIIATSFVSLVNIATQLDQVHDDKIEISAFVFDRMISEDKFQRDNEIYKKSLAEISNSGNPDDAQATRNAKWLQTALENSIESKKSLSKAFDYEASNLARNNGGSEDEWHRQLTQTYASKGSAGFASEARVSFKAPSRTAYAVLTLLLVGWWVSLVLQGEGMALDVSRRRHPMWEWYLGFPIPQSAVFTAEALAPIVSSPFMLFAPVLLAVLIGVHQDSVVVGLCALPIAVPLMISAAIWAKALEVVIMLRSSMRNRGAWFGLFGALGFVATFLPVVLLQAPAFSRKVVAALIPLAEVLPSAQGLLDVATVTGWLHAMGTSTLVGLALALPAFLAMRFATARGLESGFGKADNAVRNISFRAPSYGRFGWLSDPLLHKEWLWLKRDRGALLQLVGIPLLLVGVQFFNLQNALRMTELSWNKFAGLVVGMGGYMLFISGPRALLSEGPALALTLTWPRSLEDTLRMKVRLLFALVSSMVVLCFIVLAWMFPADVWKIFLVLLAWPLFGLSVAEKAVTLIRQPSQSGESEALPQSQMWLVSLGNLTFAIGIFTAQWQLAIAAIALNWVFAGALWQGFRLRLAYLFDPDSEPQLRPPTILSSVIAIVGLMEFGAVLSIVLTLFLGPGAAVVARVMGYGIAAVLVSVTVWRWHAGRGVTLRDILCIGEDAPFMPFVACVGAAVLGIALGAVALGYQHLLSTLPWPELQEQIESSRKFLAESPGARQAYAIMAIGIAPWDEEFIFRGLMFRAMLPQWGWLRAVIASSACFAVLHPVTAWPMVFALGVINAIVFMRTRTLLPCILLHLCYNAIVIGLSF